MKTVKTLLAAATLLAAISGSTAAFAVDEYNVSTGAAVGDARLALRGVDAVALATGLEVTEGNSKHATVRDGVAYYFETAEAKKAFDANPEKYMPQYGGFCAFGVAVGKKLDASPRYADIVDGKLYVFLNAGAFAKYKEDKAGTLAKAEKNWPGMHHLAVSEVNG